MVLHEDPDRGSRLSVGVHFRRIARSMEDFHGSVRAGFPFQDARMTGGPLCLENNRSRTWSSFKPRFAA